MSSKWVIGEEVEAGNNPIYKISTNIFTIFYKNYFGKNKFFNNIKYILLKNKKIELNLSKIFIKLIFNYL